MNRREFIQTLGAFAIFPDWSTTPDTILYNTNIVTISKRQRAQAIAIAGAWILAVGDNDKVRSLATGKTKQINLDGKTIVPGFIDAHTHPAYAGRYHLRAVDCDLRSIADIVSALRERAQKTPPGNWVLGFKYDDTKVSERRFLNRLDLDAASPAHPILVEHRGGHTAFVNSMALKLANVSKSSLDPEGGKFEHDPSSGELTGRLLETATEPFWRIIPFKFTREENREAVKLISKMMSRAGVTSITDAYGSPDDLLAYQDANHSGDLSTRVYCMIGSAEIDKMIEAGMRTGFGNEWVRLGAMKMTCDGSISERTARLSKPYVGRPNDFGILVTSEKELWDRALKAHRAGWQLGIHANGDVAIDLVLQIYERLQKEYPVKDPRFRIEHCTVVNEDLIRRMKALNVIPNPFSTYVYYHGEKMKEYGPERLENMFAVKSFLNAGLRVTQTSDYPPGPFEPMMALQSSVTRTDRNGHVWGASQKISPEEALRVGTLHGAYASFEEHWKGSLEPRKLADLVVLGQDPTKVEPSSLIEIPVERTMVGGKWVHGV